MPIPPYNRPNLHNKKYGAKDKVTRTLIIAAALLVSLAACDGNDNSSETNGTKYLVRYEATGTFTTACDFFYITRRADVDPDEENQGGTSTQASDQLPWEHAFEITVTTLHPFVTQIGAVCSDAQAKDVAVAIFVDGAEKARDEASGTVVSATASYNLGF